MMELQRISSHFVWIATSGLEIGAITMMLFGLREREQILNILETITGLRMNHAYVRPGGVAQDLPPGAVEKVRELLRTLEQRVPGYDQLLTGQPIWQKRLQGVAYLDVQGCLALGVTGQILPSAA